MNTDFITKVRQEVVARFDPNYVYLKQATRTALSTAFAILYCAFNPTLTQGYWAILAAAFILQTRLGYTQKQHCHYILLTTVCAAIFSLGVGLVWHHTLLLAIYLSLTTGITVAMGGRKLEFAICGFFVNLFIIMSAGLPSAQSMLLQRFNMIIFGGFIALLCSSLWYTEPLKEWNNNLKSVYQALATFSQSLSDAYLNNDNSEAILHERRNRILRLLNYLRELRLTQLDTAYEEQIIRAEHRYIALISVGNLRHRWEHLANNNEIKSIVLEIQQNLTQLLQTQSKQTISATENALDRLKQISVNKSDKKILLTYEHACRCFLRYFND